MSGDFEKVLGTYNFGDSELVAVHFKLKDVWIDFRLTGRDKVITLKFFQATYVSIISDMMQNVMDRVTLYDSRRAAIAAFASLQGSFPQRGDNDIVLLGEPVAGARLVISAARISLDQDMR